MNKISFFLQQNNIGTLTNKKLDLALSAHSLSLTEFMVMYYLDNAPGKTLSRMALAEKVALTASGVTRVLLPMEKIGLVKKDLNPRDARQSLVVLTQTAQEITQDAITTVENTLEAVFSLLNEDEISNLVALLHRLKL